MINVIFYRKLYSSRNLLRYAKEERKKKKKTKKIQVWITERFVVVGRGLYTYYTRCYYTELYLRKRESSEQYMIKHVQVFAAELFKLRSVPGQ